MPLKLVLSNARGLVDFIDGAPEIFSFWLMHMVHLNFSQMITDLPSYIFSQVVLLEETESIESTCWRNRDAGDDRARAPDANIAEQSFPEARAAHRLITH